MVEGDERDFWFRIFQKVGEKRSGYKVQVKSKWADLKSMLFLKDVGSWKTDGNISPPDDGDDVTSPTSVR